LKSPISTSGSEEEQQRFLLNKIMKTIDKIKNTAAVDPKIIRERLLPKNGSSVSEDVTDESEDGEEGCTTGLEELLSILVLDALLEL